jgi:hypothetical protein
MAKARHCGAMDAAHAHVRYLAVGFLVGAVALFLLTVGVLVAVGVEGWGVTVAGVFVGLFAGGALGALVALRVEQAREA